MNHVAVLVTCYNRVDTTITCLESFYQMKIPEGYQLDVYLVDDKSPDKTGTIVKEQYPQINIIEGTGNLYWNGGMRLAWQKAESVMNYDFFLWLNDDTVLFQNAFETLINDYSFLLQKNVQALIEGIFCDSDTGEVTYSGSKKRTGKLSPCGKPQYCDFITGNMVLISRTIYEKAGILSKYYSHGIGDTDYGLRTLKNGFRCAVSGKSVGYCKANLKIQWHNPDNSFIQRWTLLFSKTGGDIVEYLHFVYIHRGILGFVISFFHTAARLFFPKQIKK